jgi:hypothetical protein
MPRSRVPEAEMQRARFVVKYDGDAVRTGTMDVRALAPALLALGDLCEQANRQLNDESTAISVRVRAFGEGSFDVYLVLAVGLTQAIVNALGFSGGIKNVHDILTLLFGKDFEDSGLVGLVRTLRGHKITKVTQLENGVTKLEIDHKVTHDVSERVYKMYQNRQVQKNLQGFVSPLKRAGIETIEVRDEDKKEIIQAISQEDLPAFDELAAPTVTPEGTEVSEIEKTFKVVSLSSNPRDKWKLTDGDSVISVRVDDRALHEKAKAGRLGIEPGFIVKVRIRSETTFTHGEPATDNHLVEIMEASPPPADNRTSIFDYIDSSESLENDDDTPPSLNP